MNITAIFKWVITNFKKNSSIQLFANINQTYLKVLKNKMEQPQTIALFEVNHAFTTHILYSLICQIKFAENFKLIGYRPLRYRKIKDLFSYIIFSRFSIDNGVNRAFYTLKSMGIKSFIQPSNLTSYKKKANLIYQDIKFRNKYELLNLTIEQVRVGDLFYDWHLRTRFLDTIDLTSPNFKKDFLFFVRNFYWWYDFMTSNKVDSVFASHSCIELALPGRIAMKFGSKSYVAAWSKIYKLNTTKKFSDLEFIDYDPEAISQFGYTINRESARKSLIALREGKFTIDAHSLGSGYKGASNNRVIKNPSNLNVLIASHCFSDPPHSYGDMLFPDFREWLNFIGQTSRELNYDFYIKEHPAFWESDKAHFRKFLTEFPHITAISSNYSNLQLFSQGIKAVLTVYGTIAFEASYEGILVINASQVSPHCNYNFSVTPKSTNEFRSLLFDLPIILKNWQIDVKQVEHFFSMHHLRKTNNLMFSDRTQEFYNFIGGAGQQYNNPKVLDFWNNKIDLKHKQKIKIKIKNFLESDRYMLIDGSSY